VGEIPGALALNPRTHTLYVANSGNTLRGQTVSVLDTSRCRADRTGGCTHFPRIAPAVAMPFAPEDIAIDQRTDTIYVSGGGQLAVLDGSRCRAGSTRGCGRAMHVFTIPGGAGGVSFDPSTRTLYVVDYFSGQLSVIDGRACRAGKASGCHPRAHVKLGHHPWRVAVDLATHTVYVTLFGAGVAAVLDAHTCNGQRVSGCARPAARVKVGSGPEGLAFDDIGHLGFVTNAVGNTVSVFDTAHCRAADTTGCGPALATVAVGGLPDGIAFDPRTSTLYVTDNRSTARGLAVLRVAGRG
jgi:DNA-binding beta-propeller fold protein YncE